ncbi:hypothetical protein ACVBEQ_27380 [Nakamurella sp. GG22]
MTSAKGRPPQALSPRSVRAYAGDWALFTDWCSAAEEWELPADSDTVLSFLTDCPAAPATQRRRVTAIDHHHTTAGYPRPGDTPQVRAALGRPVPQPDAAPVMSDAVEAALRGLPSHGWTRGMFGRRDRCLLVLSQLAGVPYKHLATLHAGNITLVDGVATISARPGTWQVLPGGDPVLCGPCAVARWLRVLNMEATHPSTRDLAKALKKAGPVTGTSPHLCRSTRPLDPATLPAPLLAPIDQWGYAPLVPQRLTPHSVSRRTRDLLVGDLGAHRDLPVDTHDEPETPTPAPVPAPRAVYTKADAQRAWERRRADLQDLAGVEATLHEVDARAKELQQRITALLEDETGG